MVDVLAAHPESAALLLDFDGSLAPIVDDPAAIGALVRSLEERPAKAAVFQTGVGTKALFGATDALGLTAKLLELVSRMVVAVRVSAWMSRRSASVRA